MKLYQVIPDNLDMVGKHEIYTPIWKYKDAVMDTIVLVFFHGEWELL